MTHNQNAGVFSDSSGEDAYDVRKYREKLRYLPSIETQALVDAKYQ